MAKIKAFPEPKAFDERELDPRSIKAKIDKKRDEFFPPWVLTIALGLVWLSILPGVLAVLAANLVSGAIAGVGLVLSSVLALLLYDTYSPSWRSLAWAIPLSMILTYVAIQVGDFPGKLLMVIIPTGLFIALRANMNGRKMLEMWRMR